MARGKYRFAGRPKSKKITRVSSSSENEKSGSDSDSESDSHKKAKRGKAKAKRGPVNQKVMMMVLGMMMMVKKLRMMVMMMEIVRMQKVLCQSKIPGKLDLKRRNRSAMRIRQMKMQWVRKKMKKRMKEKLLKKEEIKKMTVIVNQHQSTHLELPGVVETGQDQWLPDVQTTDFRRNCCGRLNSFTAVNQGAWPSEIQVLKGRVHHLYHVPSEPEPFYRMTGTEKTPMSRGEENGGQLVFEYDPKFSFFMRSRVGGSRNGCSKCCVDLESDNDTTLLFESRFESGNLAKAVKVGEYDYELWLRYDLYTNKHTQWFYFRIMNMRPNVQYRFTIVNFLKPDSLYNFGMRPCMYSEKEAQHNKVGWIRAGQNIKYYRNNLRIKYKIQILFLDSHTDYLLDLQNDPIKSRICKQRILCRTLAGNLVYVLTITSSSQNPEDMKHKKAVVITSRVHPGESNSSWMMKGFLDYLTGNSADAKLLRDTFIFKIVPMLNPDGVIVGNYRCSLAGRDLNRNYKTVLKDSYPSVWHTKTMIRNFPYEACKFKVQKSKEGTGRVVMWNMGIMNSYTMEATFCGSSLGKKKGFHFSMADYESLGYHFCDTRGWTTVIQTIQRLVSCDSICILQYANILYNLENRLKMEILARFGRDTSDPSEIHLSDYASDMESR
nr:hypothetical protein BaRGS_009922 [Batillaria attramentaria]